MSEGFLMWKADADRFGVRQARHETIIIL